MLILDKNLGPSAYRASILGIFLLFGADQASAEGFLDSIKHLVVASSSVPRPVAYSATRNAYEPEVDRVSKECVGCHNGVQATNIELKSARSPREFSGHRSLGHPVGMYYEDYAHTLPSEYRPMDALATDIDFVDGKVSCISCHRSNASPSKTRSVAGNHRNEQARCSSATQLNSGSGGVGLCQSCHIM